MESEDEMQDAWAGTSDGEFDYKLEDLEDDDDETDHLASDDDENDESDYGFDYSNADDLHPSSRLPQTNFTVLSENDIRQRQDEAVATITNFLSISPEDAGVLLRHFKWSVSKVNDEWFADEERVRASVGLLEKPATSKRPSQKEMTCEICFEVLPFEKMRAPRCGHYFCEACWTGYLHTAINDGPGCLTLRCAEPSCGSAIGEDMVLGLVSSEDQEKYNRYLLRSYVEDNRKVKWCPAPGCDYALEFQPGIGSFDLVCKCGFNFCWNCREEAHRPVDCETVNKWILKNCAESENMNWILANSKPCPKCKRPIEKNQGCMHITCTPPCKFEFCWLCLGAWTDHGERTGGFYACNRYETAKQEGVYDEAERRREMAKNSLERYTHYYERWATNESSRAKALADLLQMQQVQMEKLSDRQCQPVSQLKFVTDAWLQIVECRRVLKWTYAYGYYLPENEHTKRQFFEYSQGEAEAGLERLHQCAEKDLQTFLETDAPTSSFNDFRTKLAGLTSVTRTYFENLVRALENNLSDIDIPKGTSKSSSSSKASGSSKPRAGRAGKVSSRTAGGGSSRGGGSGGGGGGEEPTHWSCEHCTFANPIATAPNVCTICNYSRL